MGIRHRAPVRLPIEAPMHQAALIAILNQRIVTAPSDVQNAELRLKLTMVRRIYAAPDPEAEARQLLSLLWQQGQVAKAA